MVEHVVGGRHVGHYVALAAVGAAAGRPREGLPVQRQQLDDLGFHRHGADHLGVDHVDLIQMSFAEQLDECLANLPGTVNRGVLCGVHELAVHRHAPMMEIVAACLPDQKQRGVALVLEAFVHQPQHVVVVSTCQPLIAGDDDVPHLVGPTGPGVEVDMLHALGAVQNVRDRPGDLLEVRLHVVELTASLAQFGGGDQVHSVGDLQGLLHTVDVGADFLYAFHVALTCSL